MKYTLILSLLFVIACNKENADATVVTKAVPGVPVTSNVLTTPESVEAVKAEEKKEEDCDTKAKKKVEIKEDSINLLNNNTGCSLDEMNK